MSRRYRFRQVDVFTDRPLHGNPLAVFPDAAGLSDAEMQALAREMNVSETAFVLPPTDAGRAEGADYRVRIFTPGLELPFAGHPSIGTAWVMADEGRLALRTPRTHIRQELAIGVLPLSIEVDDPASGSGGAGSGSVGSGSQAPGGEVQAPDVLAGSKPRIGAVTMTQGPAELLERLDGDEVADLCQALEVATDAVGWRDSRTGRAIPARPAIISTGLPHLIIPFSDRDVMTDIEEERQSDVSGLLEAYDCDSAALLAPGNSGTIADADVSVRIFDARSLRIDADPATGAAAGPIAVYLGQLAGARGRTYRVVVEQGVELGRPSRLVAEVDFSSEGSPTEVRVSGEAVPVIEGWVTLP